MVSLTENLPICLVDYKVFFFFKSVTRFLCFLVSHSFGFGTLWNKPNFAQYLPHYWIGNIGFTEAIQVCSTLGHLLAFVTSVLTVIVVHWIYKDSKMSCPFQTGRFLCFSSVISYILRFFSFLYIVRQALLNWFFDFFRNSALLNQARVCFVKFTLTFPRICLITVDS